MDQLAGLTEEARKLALDRFRQLQPHLEDDRPLKAVAAAAGIPFRTAQRWVCCNPLTRISAGDLERYSHKAPVVRQSELGIGKKIVSSNKMRVLQADH
jgi:hypothetical protein